MFLRSKFALALPVLAGFAFLTFLAVSPALAATSSGGSAPRSPGGGKGGVTRITADSMVYDSDNRLVTFSKKVRVVQPDFTMISDSLEMHLSSGGAGASAQALGTNMEGGQVEKIIARNNVNIRLPDGRTATCNKATYTVHDEVVVMEGNPVLREDSNILSADIIRFYMKESRSTAHGNVKVDFVTKNGGSNGAGGIVGTGESNGTGGTGGTPR
ncbi:MAG: LptA/OstA family protein [Deltaproteobacteria bacterium]|jgi:lipopolysaccharide export system protein LptA|nr:LptA/OstA family protein [Deltaproteobacteria bacterium]